ncbi:TolB-like translocation protein [Myxococcus qinghaiensis]|uniref:hypothetical protein n=1 Tax=Myxococcus qinghaiensis TaxID=2906758 RepID=UPI0020A75C12|nr:hypothetical protein [Myxococcus qinghaiensis]MCP3166099.1 hypothetical protein [Myxococcus qinghaiensis]
MTPRAGLLLSIVWLFTACASRERLPSTELPTGEYGTPHPFLLQASAPDGRWLLACQVREDTNQDGAIEVEVDFHGELLGDEARPYLFLEPGAGVAIEDVLAWDTSGRHLVLVREGALRLLDTVKGTEQVLASWAADDVDSKSPQPPVRASFSRDGKRLLYLRRDEAGKTVAVLRDVARGQERVLDAGPGLLGQAFLHDGGRWVLFDVVAEDTNADGTLTWPQEQTSLAPAMCRGPVSSSTHGGWKGDKPVRRLQRLEGGPLLEGKDILRPFGDGLIRTAPDGALDYEDEHGQRTTWVPASCQARLYDVDEPRRLLVVGCTKTDSEDTNLELHGPELHVSLEREVSTRSLMRRPIEPRPRLLPIFVLHDKDTSSTYGLLLLDMERHALVTPPLPDSSWVHAFGTHALLEVKPSQDGAEQGKARLWLWSADTGDQRLLGDEGEYAHDMAGERLLLYMGWLLDLNTAQVLGTVEGTPLAIDTRGRALRSTHADRLGVPIGPVKWEPAVKPSVKPTSPPVNTPVAPPPSGP